MSLRIAGMGWVTPLGSGVEAVWKRLCHGDQPAVDTVSSPLNSRTFPVFRVPAEATAKAPAHPRLRRSSAISRFAAVAGMAALEDAGLALNAAAAERTAIIFAISNGGVVYTKRFYHEVVESGARAASPLLFPETVFNAPASHLAAILGITGASYTLVGDGAVGILALKMAEDLMETAPIDQCLVVASEEADWLLCDAYRRWRLLRTSPPVEVFRSVARGTILSEGAGALLVDRTSATTIETIDAGYNFSHQREAAACVDKVFARLGANDEDIVIASANGTFVDRAERAALQRRCPLASVYAPKVSLGESVGAASLWQVIAAAQALKTGHLPPMAHTADKLATRSDRHKSRRAIVSACGLNQQAAGLSITLQN